MTYEALFRKATGNDPYPYQKRLAEAEWPEVLRVPTGAGKTAAVILSWLYQREKGLKVPTRLVFCLPMRVLVSQTIEVAKKWLQNLGLDTRYQVCGLMGGFLGRDGFVEEEWELNPSLPCILVGTQDMLLSRALNRGYAMSRYRWSVPFGLLHSDCQWVFDEVQLMGVARNTSVQLQAFRERFGTFGASRSLWMSATLQPIWLETVDRKAPTTVDQLRSDDLEFPSLKNRVEAEKLVEPVKFKLNKETKKDYSKKLATETLSLHQPGSLTLVILNQVERAVELYQTIQKAVSKEAQAPQLLLLHSRFRPVERQLKEQQLRELQAGLPQAGAIIVSTQVVEAGVDLSSRLLITELCPFSSMVQRLGRCNRDGQIVGGGVVRWIDVEEPALPYEDEQLSKTRGILNKLTQGSPRALESLLGELDEAESLDVIRRKDMLELFHTTSDLAGDDVDVSRYIREPNHLDIQVFWRLLAEDGKDLQGQAQPARDELCSVSLSQFREFLSKERRAYRWSYAEDEWKLADRNDLKPGQVYLVASDSGGYDADLGFGKDFKVAVTPVEVEDFKPKKALASKSAPTKVEVATATDEPTPDSPPGESYGAENPSGYRLTLEQHTLNVWGEMKRLLESSDVENLPSELLLSAALWHDYGKAHLVFQATMYGGGDKIDPQVLLGKSNLKGRHQKPGFRHEFASALAALQHNAPALVVFLVATHHGKIRFSVRPIPQELEKRQKASMADSSQLSVRGVCEGDVLPEATFGDLTIGRTELSLAPLELGQVSGCRSWSRTLLPLIDCEGIFRLAYLESLMRCADVRASKAENERLGVSKCNS